MTEVLDARLPALEQLLVTFPRLISAGPSALTPGDQKFGRVHLNLNQSPAACTEGYLPPGQWRPTSEEELRARTYPAECASGAPVNMRGMKYAPDPIDWKNQSRGQRVNRTAVTRTVLAVILVALCGWLALFAVRGSEAAPGSTPTEELAQQYTDIRRAARAETLAFLAVDHKRMDELTDRVISRCDRRRSRSSTRRP